VPVPPSGSRRRFVGGGVVLASPSAARWLACLTSAIGGADLRGSLIRLALIAKRRDAVRLSPGGGSARWCRASVSARGQFSGCSIRLPGADLRGLQVD